MNHDKNVVDEMVAPFCDGTVVSSGTDARIDVINPSNGKRLLSIPTGSRTDVDRAVRAGRQAFESGQWSEAPPSFRKRVMHRFADLIAGDSTELDYLDAGEMGKPISLAFGNAASAAGTARFYAEAVDKISGDVYTSDSNSFVSQRRVPRGVVGAIVPWNFPTSITMTKIAPALAAGNCVVLKPSELSSRSAMRLARLAMEAGMPKGVLNVVPGSGEAVGQALGLHMDVDMLTFTGSTAVGKLLLQYSGQSNMKLVMAECGGKSPHIVFDDGVDLDTVSESIARQFLTNQGQICSIGSRLLVERSIEEALLEKVAAKFTRVTMGDALNPDTNFGPLASARQCARVMNYIDTAPNDGAQLMTGGRRALQESGGYFIEPTIFRNVSPSARIAQEEVFGPVLSTIAFDSREQAVRIANATVYGLAAYVWTADLTTGMKMAKALRSPVRINSAMPAGEGAGHAAAYEPVGQSGIGVEGGMAGMESYLRRQRVWFNHA